MLSEKHGGTMTYHITADTRRGQETETAETELAALAWIAEFRERGATEFYIWDYEKRRRYTERELEELANAQGS
jgi:hypothetical protein